MSVEAKGSTGVAVVPACYEQRPARLLLSTSLLGDCVCVKMQNAEEASDRACVCFWCRQKLRETNIFYPSLCDNACPAGSMSLPTVANAKGIVHTSTLFFRVAWKQLPLLSACLDFK